MNPACLFCLEPIEKNTVGNPIGCACKVSAHTTCFEQWFQQKHQMECPICHTISIPNQIAMDNIRVVFIDATNTRPIERNSIFRGHEKAATFCCCLLMGWAIGLTILDLVFGNR